MLGGGDLLSTSPAGGSDGGNNILLDILSLGEAPAPVSTSSASPDSLTGVSQPSTKDPFAASLMDLADPPRPRGGQSGVGSGGGLLDADRGSSGVDGERKASLLDDLGVTPSAAQTSRKGSLLDDFEIAPIVPASTSGFSTIVALQSPGLEVLFDFTKPPATPQNTVIRASYLNLSDIPYTDFVFQAAVPKFLQLQVEPASGITLQASGGGIITQVINITNTLHGQKSLLMKLRIIYKVNGEEKIEQGQVSNFPQGL